MSNYNLTYSWNDSSVVTFAGTDWKTEQWETWNFRWTYMPTSNVTFTFPVPAVAFYFSGLPAVDTNGNFAVCIDCSLGNNSYETAQSTRVTSGEIYSPPIVFYSKKFLQSNTHKVTIWPMNGQITVDRFVIEVGTPSSTSAVTTPTPYYPSPSSSHNEGAPIGAIIGAIIGGICALVLMCFLLYWCRGRGRSSKGAADGEEKIGAIIAHIPYPQTYASPNVGIDSKVLKSEVVNYKGLPEPCG